MNDLGGLDELLRLDGCCGEDRHSFNFDNLMIFNLENFDIHFSILLDDLLEKI